MGFSFWERISFRFQLGGGDLSAGGLSLRGGRPEKEEAEAKAAKAKSSKKKMIPELRKKYIIPEKNVPIFSIVF